LYLISKLDLTVGIPLNDLILNIRPSPNLNQLILGYSYDYDFLVKYDTFSNSNPLTPYFNHKIVLISLKSESGYTTHHFMIVNLNVFCSDVSRLLSTDSLEFKGANFLSVSLLGRISVRNANFLYTPTTYGWSNDQTNPPIPYIPSSLSFSTADLYFRVILILIGIVVVYLIIILRKPSQKLDDRDPELLFPKSTHDDQ